MGVQLCDSTLLFSSLLFVTTILFSLGLVTWLRRLCATGSRLISGRLVLDRFQVKLAVLQIDFGDLDGEQISEAISVTVFEPADHMPTTLETVFVLRQARDRDEPIDR